jgi:hypothetical protein
MPTHSFKVGVWASIALAGLTHAHMAPFHKAMYCINVIKHPSHCNSPAYTSFACVLWQGTDPNVVDLNNNQPVDPLWNLTYNDYWFHHSNGVTFNHFKVHSYVDHDLVVRRVSTRRRGIFRTVRSSFLCIT